MKEVDIEGWSLNISKYLLYYMKNLRYLKTLDKESEEYKNGIELCEKEESNLIKCIKNIKVILNMNNKELEKITDINIFS